MLYRSIAVFLFLLISVTVLGMTVPITHASPPPTEIDKIKAQAPLHVTGTILTDQYISDQSNDAVHPAQLRKITLQLDNISKQPQELHLVAGNLLEIYYKYIPRWSAEEYVGGNPIWVASTDKIEIWLIQEQNQWVPAYTGYTVNILHHAKAPKDYIDEPLSHRIQRFFHMIPLAFLSGITVIAVFTIWFFYRLFCLIQKDYHH